MLHPSGKLIIVTAPSGAGKTTIVKHLLEVFPQLAFSVSATSRNQRPDEVHGRDYYYISASDFRQSVERGAFLEWEEVYPGQYYGTLQSEVVRLWNEDKHIIFDIDVHGGRNLKEAYPGQSLAIFIKPPSPDVLNERLQKRQTESAEDLQKRIDKAAYELSFEPYFDQTLVNDDLEKSLAEAERIVGAFLQAGAQ